MNYRRAKINWVLIMEHETNTARSVTETDSDHGAMTRRQWLQEMLAGNETDLKDEEPDCYVLGYN